MLNRTAKHQVRRHLGQVARLVILIANHGGEEIELVHELRTETRRANRALRVFSEWLPQHQADRIGKRLAAIRRNAGKVRDLDMLLPSLLSFAELIPSQIMTQFSVIIRDQRVGAMHSLKKACVGLLKRQFDRDIRLLSRRVIWRGKAKPPKLTTFLSQRIAPLALRFFAEFEFMGIEPQRLHDVRILGRRLRYELDLFQKALDGPEFRLIGTNLAEIQERLGQVHDRWTVLQFLREFSGESRTLPESLVQKFPDLEAIINQERIQAFQESLENVARVKLGLEKWTHDRNAVD